MHPKPPSKDDVTKMATLLLLLVGFGLMQMGNTLQGTLLSVRGGLESFAPLEIGAIGAGFWVGVMLGSLWVGKLVERVGHIRTFLALGAIAATAAQFHLLIVNPLAWIIVRALTGFCFAGLFIVVESWLNTTASAGVRGQIMSIYAMTGLGAGIIGQLLLSVAEPGSYRLFCLVTIIIALALVPIAVTRAQAPAAGGQKVRINLRALYRQSPFGLVAAVLCGISTSAFFALAPILAQHRGLGSAGVALFMASATFGGLVMAWPIGWLSDRLERRMVIIGAALVASASIFLLLVLSSDEPSRWFLYLDAAVLGGTIVPTYSVVMAHMNDAVGEGEFVAAAGGLLIMQGVGAVAGPLLAGFAMSVWEAGLNYTLIAAQLLLAIFGLYRTRARSAPARTQKGAFVLEPSVLVGTTLEEQALRK